METKTTKPQTLVVSIIGDGGVGKSNLCLQFLGKEFQEIHDPTIEDSYSKVFQVDNQIFRLEIIDTAGQEEFKMLRDGYIRRSNCFVLVYDITNSKTLLCIQEYLQSIKNIKEKYGLVLVGNKCDLERGKSGVSFEEGTEIAKVIDAYAHYETSAKEKINIEKVFDSVIRDYLEKENLEKIKNKTLDKPKMTLASSVSPKKSLFKLSSSSKDDE